MTPDQKIIKNKVGAVGIHQAFGEGFLDLHDHGMQPGRRLLIQET